MSADTCAIGRGERLNRQESDRGWPPHDAQESADPAQESAPRRPLPSERLTDTGTSTDSPGYNYGQSK